MRMRLLLRQATSSLGASMALALIVAVVSGLFTAWPRLQAQTFVEEASHQIAQTPRTSRALTAEMPGWPHVVSPDWSVWDDRLAALVAAGGPALSTSAGVPRFSITSTTPLPYTSDVPRPSDLAGVLLSLRVDPAIERYVRLTAGTLPAPSPIDPEAFVEGGRQVVPTDIMLSEPTAQRLGLDVGDELVIPSFARPVPLRLSGTFVAADAEDEQWEHQLNTIAPAVSDDPNVGLVVTGIAYVHHETVTWLPTLVGDAFETEFWIPITPSATDTPQLVTDLRRFTGVPQAFALDPQSGIATELDFSSTLADVLTGVVERRNGTTAVLTMVAAGPVGVTVAVLALGARLAVARRRSSLALASARGGSDVQIRGALAAEGAVLGVPAAALGALLGTALVPADGAGADYVLPAVAGLAPALFLATSSLPSLRTSRPDLTSRSTSRYRWVVEVLVLGLAAACVYVLLDRGLEGASTTSVDPLAAAAPLLVSLAACVLALRLYPVPLAAAHSVMRSRRGLSGFLGSARAMREGTTGLVPMLALIVGVSIAVFSTTMVTTLRGGVDTGAAAAVGADVRLAGPYFTPDLVEEVRTTEGVADVAAVADVLNIPLSEDGTSRRVTVVAADTRALARVQADVPGAVGLPEAMDTLADGRVPVLVSAAHGPDPDARLHLFIENRVDVELLGQPEEAPGVASGTSWVLVDLALLREATGQRLVPRLLLVDTAEGVDTEQVLQALSDVMGGAGTITSPGQGVEAFLESPSAASMQRGFLLALAVSLALSVVAVVMTLVLAAPARGRLLAVLRTLGVGPRAARRLVAWETTPLALAALVVGVALGLALPQLVAATVDLRPFTGDDTQPAIRYEPLLLAGVVAALALILAGCVALASAVARRLSLSVLRIGDLS